MIDTDYERFMGKQFKIEDFENDRIARDQLRFRAGWYSNLCSYLNSYEEAIDLFVKTILKSNGPNDWFGYPLLFMIRHYLELGFKWNIHEFRKYNGNNEYQFKNVHDLKDLYKGFKYHVEKTIDKLQDKNNQFNVTIDSNDINAYNTELDNLNKMIEIMDELDKNSTSFRYPTDTKGNVNYDKNKIIDLYEILVLYNKCRIVINHTIDLFGQYINYSKIMEEELNNIYDYEYGSL